MVTLLGFHLLKCENCLNDMIYTNLEYSHEGLSAIWSSIEHGHSYDIKKQFLHIMLYFIINAVIWNHSCILELMEYIPSFTSKIPVWDTLFESSQCYTECYLHSIDSCQKSIQCNNLDLNLMPQCNIYHAITISIKCSFNYLLRAAGCMPIIKILAAMIHQWNWTE